jgi:hypothetical protein
MRLTSAIGFLLATSLSANTADVKAQAKPKGAQQEIAADKGKKSAVNAQAKPKDAQNDTEQEIRAIREHLARATRVRLDPASFSNRFPKAV